MTRRAIQTAFWILATAGLGFVILRPLENKLLYFPDREDYGSPSDAGLAYTDVNLVASDGVRLHAWHVKVAQPVALVIHFHGNAGNLSGRVPFAAAFAGARMDTLLVDYRGYGRSEGTPSEEGLYRDADAAWAWAEPRGLPVVVYGESLGGAVAIDLASRRRPALLVAQSTFTRLAEMADRTIPFGGALVSQKYDSISKIGRVEASVLVVHGDADEIVPFEMGRTLFGRVRSRKEFLRLAGVHHNDLVERAGPEVAARMAAMLRSE